MTEPVALSVIIPAYNEESRLPAYLDEILAYLGRKDFPSEIIIVDDGSIDGTSAVVKRFRACHPTVRLLRFEHNHGKGFAVKAGMLEATGRLRLFTDADGATPISELERLRPLLEAGAEVAVASRALHDDACTVREKLSRKIIGSVFNAIVRTLTVHGINDTQCGFKLFSAAAATSVFPLQRISGFGFDVEVLFICRRHGYRIVEVPVNWTDVAGTKVRVMRDAPRMFLDVVKIRFNDWRGAYRGGSR